MHDALSALCTTPSPRPDAGGVFQHGVPGPALRWASSSTVGVAPRDVKYVLSFFWAIAALSLATLIGASWWALPRHFADTSETPPRHLRDTSETLPRHLRDISETLPRHFRERHFRDNSTPPRHLLAALPRTPTARPIHTPVPRISRPVPSSCARSTPAAENGSSFAAFNSLRGAAHEPAAARAVRRILLVVCPLAVAGHAFAITATRCRYFWRHTRGAIALQAI